MQVAKDLENKYVKYGPKAEQGTINQCHTHIHEPKERAPTHHQEYSDGPLSALSFSSRGKEMQPKQRRRDQRGRTGIKRNNQLRVVLFTHARKRGCGTYHQDNTAQAQPNHKGLLQYWAGYLTVHAFSDRVVTQQKNKLTARGTNDFKLLYHICMADGNLKERERELAATGYLGAMCSLDWTVTSGVK